MFILKTTVLRALPGVISKIPRLLVNHYQARAFKMHDFKHALHLDLVDVVVGSLRALKMRGLLVCLPILLTLLL